MRVLLIGGNGQLGRELRQTAASSITLTAPPSSELSITNGLQVSEMLASSKPELVVNAGAYTAVDDAEADRETAFSVNAEGARNVATAAAQANARLIHVSTDFVFGVGQNLPLQPSDRPHPLSVYGESKLAGEEAVLATHSRNSLVVRTSWLYSSSGRNFVKTMLRLFRSGGTIRVVADQIGTPTWARSLAVALWKWSELPNASGIRHFSDAGVASWYDFAVAIHQEASRLGLIEDGSVEPIRSDEYPTAARRPAWSVLDAFASWKELEMAPRHWRESLVEMLGELSEGTRPERGYA